VLSYAEARAALLATAAPLDRTTVPIRDAAGRALAASIVSPVALPPWNNAGMDGYAVRRDDVLQATTDTPVTLRVIGTIAAGADATQLPVLGPGEAVRIMTGAPVPASANAVVRIEDTDRGDHVVAIRDTRDTAGRGNIRPLGEDVAAGEALFAVGDRISPSHIGVLASIGCAEVPVYVRPRVTVLCGGDELVLLDRFDEVLAGRRIVSSSSYALPALLRDAGAEVTVMPLVPDTLDDTVRAITSAIDAGCDVLVTTGGVSVGAYDYTRDALVAVGGRVDFWRAKIRPGGPIGTGDVRGTRWLGLPGNPVSTMVTATVFAWPLLRALGGYSQTSLRTVRVTMRDHFDTPAPLTYFVRVALSDREDGGYEAHLAGPQGSNLLRTMALANALMIVPESVNVVSPNAVFDAVMLP